MKTRILLSPPHSTGNEMEYIQNAFDANWIAPGGPTTEAFENAISQYTGSKHVVALASGTAALHLALIVLGVGKDDIVLCQSLTFVATVNPIRYQQAIPVFIDSEPITWNLCPDALEDCIKHYLGKGKKPKAVIGVHLFGMPFQTDEILDLCIKYDIPLIEDAAEALGSTYKNQQVGSFGTMGIFSFNGNKIITTSAGGALISGNDQLIHQAKFLAEQARDAAPYYQHSQVGYNYRMSNICAGIGLAQLEVIEERVARRRANFDFYRESLASLPGITFQHEPDGYFSNRWLTVILVEPDTTDGIARETIRLDLEKENIESRPVWKPMHIQPVFSGTKFYGNRLCEKLFENGLCLPSGSRLATDDLERISQCIKKSFHSVLPRKD